MEYLNNDTVVEYKSRLVKLFEKFIFFCEEYSLDYFCTGGTMLGAVRHHGFIPWDDDIDLFMMRRDYNKLIELRAELQNYGIGIEGMHIKDSNAVFIKIWDLNTTLWEIEEIPFVYGIYIDIFPLDFTNDTKEEFLKEYKRRRYLFNLIQLSQIKFSFHSILSRITQRDMKFFVKDVLAMFVPSFLKSLLKKKLIKMDNEGWNEEGDYLASYYGDYYEREYLKKEWFNGFVITDFENLRVRIPKGYDSYLSQIYHDYMKLPPKEKQISHHYHYFLDLNKHYNIEQVKLIIKKTN